MQTDSTHLCDFKESDQDPSSAVQRQTGWRENLCVTESVLSSSQGPLATAGLRSEQAEGRPVSSYSVFCQEASAVFEVRSELSFCLIPSFLAVSSGQHMVLYLSLHTLRAAITLAYCPRN